jgi:hypothetical protein
MHPNISKIIQDAMRSKSPRELDEESERNNPSLDGQIMEKPRKQKP